MLKTQPLAGTVAFLFFVSLLHSCSGESAGETVAVFKGDSTEVSINTAENGEETKLTPKSFRVPAFVGGELDGSEFLAVFSDAHYEKSEGLPFIAPAVKTSYGNYKTWSDAVIFGKDTENKKEMEVVGNVTAVMKGKKIYALVTSFGKLEDMLSIRDKETTDWDAVMFVGTVEKSTNPKSVNKMTVTWAKQTSLKHLIPTERVRFQVRYFFGGVGNGVVMKNGEIVLPVQLIPQNKLNAHNQASSIIYSTNDGSTWQLGKPTPPQPPTSECSVFEWGDGKLILSARLDYGYRIIYESDNMGASWKEFSPFTRVWGNNPNGEYLGSQGSAITAKVDEKDILLVSQPLTTKANHIRETLQLWVSDGKRISCVGTISEKGEGKQTGNSILALVGNNLYVTHEMNPHQNLKSDSSPEVWDKVIAVSPLQDFFDSAKKTVSEWRRLDEWFQSKGIPSEGLVGVLGNTTEKENVWPDVYNCVNGIVSNGESVPGGFRFNGSPNSYAKWPVEKQGQNQVYKFTNKQFTLTATVIIHDTSGASGVSFFGIGERNYKNEILFGIGYTEDRKWCILKANYGTQITDVSFQLNTEYQIAIRSVNDYEIVYVDGMEITQWSGRAFYGSSVDFFYMGSTGANSLTHGSMCTVKNVMLFNESFKAEEIVKLSNVIKYGNTCEPTSTEEPTTLPEKTEAVSTEEQITLPANKETVSTAKPITLPENPEEVSISDPKRQKENPEPISITEPPKQKEDQNPVTTKEPETSPEIEKANSTAEQTNSPQTQEALSTEGRTNSPVIKKKVSAAEPVTLPETTEAVSTLMLPKQAENQNLVTTKEPTSLPKIEETVLPAETTTLPQTELTHSTAKPTNSPKTHDTSSTGERTSVPQMKKTVLTEEQTKLPETQEAESTPETTSVPQIEKEASMTQRKKPAVTEKQEINIENEKAKNVNFFQHNRRDKTFEEQINRADSASVPFMFVKIMCFTFSIFVLTGV